MIVTTPAIARNKPKTCRNCGQKYTPAPGAQSFVVWCGPPCGVQIARDRQERARIKAQAKRIKKANAEHRVRKEALKPRSKWLAEAQQAVNSYVRERDASLPCISCGNTPAASEALNGHKMDCGHYRSRGAAPHLRFNLFNMAGQCVRCNRELSGNVVEYRKGLIERIGLEKVHALEHNNDIRKFEIEYLKRLKRIFNRRTRHIKRLRNDR